MLEKANSNSSIIGGKEFNYCRKYLDLNIEIQYKNGVES